MKKEQTIGLCVAAAVAASRAAALCAFLLIAFALAACGGGDGETAAEPPAGGGTPAAPSAVAFQVWPARVQLATGGQAAIGAPGTTAAVAWSSSDPSVATVDAAGIVSGVARGSATITATAAGATASATVRVWDTQSATPDATSEALIAAALAAGRIDDETALVYRVFARFADARLPGEYDGAPAAAGEAVTMREVSARLPALSESARATLLPFFIPPIYAESWAGVQLGVAATAALRAGRSRAAGVDTKNCIGTLIADPPRASTAHFNVFGMPFITKQSDVDAIARLLEAAYAAETSALARFPMSDADEACNGGDGAVDVYLTPLAASTEALAQTHGYRGRCNETPSYIVVNYTISAIFYAAAGGNADQRAAVDKLYRNTLAHEFMHVLQFAMERPAACADYDWIDEATAQWAMDLVYPADNMEDGRTRWSDRVRGGGFYANYAVNDHLVPLEGTLQSGEAAAVNGYSDYVFFQFLAREYGAGAVKSIFDAMTAGGSVEALEAGLRSQGGLKDVWPKFARALWLDPDNPSLSSVLTADGYDWGLARALRGEARAFARRPQSDSAIGQAGAPHATFKLFKSALSAGALQLPPRSFVVDRLVFGDDNVSAVYFANPMATQSIDGVRLDAVVKIGGQWRAVEDWTHELSKEWCRDKRDERIEEIVLIASYGTGDRSAAPVVLSADAPMAIYTSNVGCWRWQGEASAESSADDGLNGGMVRATATGVVLEVQSSGFGLDRVHLAAVAGTASGLATSHGVVPPCTVTITGPPKAISPTDAFVEFGLDLEIPELPSDRGVRLLQGITFIDSTSHAVCTPGGDETRTVTNAWSWLAYPLATNPLSISSDGRTLEADLTLSDDVTRQVHRFRFTALRE